MNKATRWQTLPYLRLPSSLPYFLSGLRISDGLALIGAVVAEFVAGAGGTDKLYRCYAFCAAVCEAVCEAVYWTIYKPHWICRASTHGNSACSERDLN